MRVTALTHSRARVPRTCSRRRASPRGPRGVAALFRAGLTASPVLRQAVPAAPEARPAAGRGWRGWGHAGPSPPPGPSPGPHGHWPSSQVPRDGACGRCRAAHPSGCPGSPVASSVLATLAQGSCEAAEPPPSGPQVLLCGPPCPVGCGVVWIGATQGPPMRSAEASAPAGGDLASPTAPGPAAVAPRCLGSWAPGPPPRGDPYSHHSCPWSHPHHSPA